MSAMIWCPFPDRETARSIADALLDARLIACANLVGEIESIFDWNSKRDCQREFAVLFKTHETRLDEAIEKIAALHPYDSPAILGWRCDSVGAQTQAWLQNWGKGEDS